MPTDDDASDVEALARKVARLRARVEELEDTLATAAVHERAKGVLMGRDGLSARAAGAELARRAGERGRTVTDECWSVLGGGARRGSSPAPPLGTLPRGRGIAAGPADTAGPTDTARGRVTGSETGPAEATDAGATAPDAGVVQAVLDTLPMPAVLLTPLWSPDGDVADYRIDAAAPESVDSVGRRGRELLGRRVLETYPTVADTDLWHGYRDALLRGTPYESGSSGYEEVAAGLPGESSYTVRAVRLGGRLVVSWACHDPLVREARRLYQMEHLGDLGWAEWNLLTGAATWSEQAYRILGRDPADGPVAWEELALHVVPEDVPQVTEAARCLREEARPLDRTFRIATGSGVRHVRFVAEAVTDPAGTAIEVHALYQDLTAQRRAEQALLESERAFLVQQGLLQAERALAKSLQEALLPRQERTLTVAGLRTEVFYLPSEEGLSVGGDWYSAIGLPDGSGLFVVGDVAGHGIGAVATMAQLRFAAKGMIVTGSPLPDALVRLNALLMHAAEGRHTTATMILARYQPWDRTMTWVQAGHLPPLLVRDGTARFLEPPAGIILGATAECSYEEQRFTLRPGDHLLLYTDGLVERPAEDIVEGLARLAAVAAGAVNDEEGAEHLTLRLTADLSPTRRDDVCLLHLSPPGTG